MSKKNKYEGIYGHKDVKIIPCTECGKPVRKHLDPRYNRGIKIVCYLCKRNLKKESDALHSEPVAKLVKNINENSGASEVKIYRPGDPEFEQVAAKCNLEPKKQELPYYDAFEDVNYYT